MKKNSLEIVLLLITLLVVVGLNQGSLGQSNPAATKSATASPAVPAESDARAPETEKTQAARLRSALLAWSSTAALAFVLVLLVAGIYRARRRIVILEFRNHSGTSRDLCEGLASRLRNELARIVELCRMVDEISGEKERSDDSPTGILSEKPQEPVGPGPSVLGEEGGAADLLKGATGPDARLKLGFLEIPVGFLLAALSGLVNGPRLTGSLHKEDDRYILIAELSGGDLSGSWRVDSSDLPPALPGSPRLALFDQLIEHLACRIATSLMGLGSPRWQAVHAYTAALREIRLAQRASMGRQPAALSRAEGHFLKALEEDTEFAPCHFNLGYVYNLLGRTESAITAYRKALALDPANGRACYALAVGYLLGRQLEDALWFSRNAISIDPHNARAWNLQSVTLRQIVTAGGQPELSGAIKRGFENAALEAWKALWRSEWTGRNREENLEVALLCTANLAQLFSEMKKHGRSRALYLLTLTLKRHDQRLWWALGKERRLKEDWQGAYEAFDHVFEEGVFDEAQLNLWVYLLEAHALLYKKSHRRSEKQLHRRGTEDCYFLARDLTALLALKDAGKASGHLEKALAACGQIPAVDGVDYVAQLRMVGSFLANAEQGDADIAAADKKWCQTQASLAEASRLERESGRKAHQWKKLCEVGEKAYKAVRSRRLAGRFLFWLDSVLSKAYLERAKVAKESDKRKHLQAALRHAQSAVQGNPESTEEHLRLGDVYKELHDFGQAEEELRIALQLASLEGTLLWDVADSIQDLYRNRPRALDNATQRRRLEDCCQLLGNTLDLVEHTVGTGFEDQEDEENQEIQWKVHGWIHSLLGSLYREQERYDKGLTHHRAAVGFIGDDPEVLVEFGRTCFEAEVFDEAQGAFKTVIDCFEKSNGANQELWAEARLGRALALAERGLQLDEASLLVQEVGSYSPKTVEGLDPDQCLGCILYHQKKYPESVQKLLLAAERAGSAKTWVFIARSYAALADESTGQKRVQALGEARNATRAAQKGDLRGVYRRILRETERQLDALERQAALPRAA